MSMKSSLFYKEYKETKSIHIFCDGMDNRYYIENEKRYRTCLPKKIAKAFVKCLEDLK